MADIFQVINQNQEMREYFYSLPALIQENIIQSGCSVNSMDDLRNCVGNLSKRK